MNPTDGPAGPPRNTRPAGKAGALVPPYPNLGPEPFDEPGLPWSWLVGLGSVTTLALLMAGLRLTRSRRRRVRRKPQGQADHPGSEEQESPRGEIVALSDAVRAALVSRFGPTWQAKTSEEIGNDPEVLDAFGPETAGRLVVLLREADRLKFAAAGSVGPSDQCEGLESWADWAADFVSAAGARSIKTGK